MKVLWLIDYCRFKTPLLALGLMSASLKSLTAALGWRSASLEV
jgi:hypothetical protein